MPLRSNRDFQNGPNLNAADKAELIAQAQPQINRKKEKQRESLADLVRFPPHLMACQAALDGFDAKRSAAGHPLAKPVFIMTKYPRWRERGAGPATQLVNDTICAAVTARGYHAHLASADKLHPNLREHLENQMLGCGRGIAIVEDHPTSCSIPLWPWNEAGCA